MKKLLFAFIVSSCVNTHPVYPETSLACDGACSRLAELQCVDSTGRFLSDPNDNGESCADFCKRKEFEGVAMRPACVAASASCSAANACFAR